MRMTSTPSSPIAALRRSATLGLVGLASANLLAACAGSPLPALGSADAALGAPPEAVETRAESSAKGGVEYWSKAYAKNPRSAEAALHYARRLRAAGDKQQAFVVLQQAASLDAGHVASSPSTVASLSSSTRSSLPKS